MGRVVNGEKIRKESDKHVSKNFEWNPVFCLIKKCNKMHVCPPKVINREAPNTIIGVGWSICIYLLVLNKSSSSWGSPRTPDPPPPSPECWDYRLPIPLLIGLVLTGHHYARDWSARKFSHLNPRVYDVSFSHLSNQGKKTFKGKN